GGPGAEAPTARGAGREGTGAGRGRPGGGRRGPGPSRAAPWGRDAPPVAGRGPRRREPIAAGGGGRSGARGLPAGIPADVRLHAAAIHRAPRVYGAVVRRPVRRRPLRRRVVAAHHGGRRLRRRPELRFFPRGGVAGAP